MVPTGLKVLTGQREVTAAGPNQRKEFVQFRVRHALGVCHLVVGRTSDYLHEVGELVVSDGRARLIKGLNCQYLLEGNRLQILQNPDNLLPGVSQVVRGSRRLGGLKGDEDGEGNCNPDQGNGQRHVQTPAPFESRSGHSYTSAQTRLDPSSDWVARFGGCVF